jgi:hypothetical protein
MDVAAETLPQDATTASQGEGEKLDGGASAIGGGKADDNKFQKAIAAWRSVYLLLPSRLVN